MSIERPEFRGLKIEHRIEDVLDDLHRVLSHHGYAIMRGRWKGESIMCLCKLEHGGIVPVAQIGEIVPGKHIDWRTISGAIPEPSPTTQRTQ